MKLVRTAIVIATVALSAVAAERKPITHEALWMLKRVGAPALSPDGRWVVTSVTEPSYDEKEQSSDLWLLPADGSAKPRRITFTKPSESDLVWSPDGTKLAFTAKREGDDASQVYLLDVAGGGEARRVTNVSTGARTPRFNADGTSIIFSSVVFPGTPDDDANKTAAKEAKDRKFNVRAYDSFPIRNWDRWLDEKEPHILVQSVEEGAKARDLLAGTKLVALPGFGGRTTEGSREEVDAEWAPDGKTIVFTATSNRNTGAYAETDVDVYRVGATGGEPEQITDDTGGYSDPRFSPDGKTIFFKFEPNNGKVYNLTRLVAFDWPSMKNRRVITANTDRSVNSWAITPDGKAVYFTAEDSGLEKIYNVPATGGNVTLALEPKSGVYTDLLIEGSAKALVVVGRWASSINPAEVVRIDLGGKSHKSLTQFAAADAAALAWDAPQHFWFTSSRGRKIHNMIVLPENFDPAKKYPLFVLIHGGAANMSRDQISLRWNYHLLAKPGYVMLMTNYTGSTGFGEQFAQNIQGDPLRGPAQELMEAADEAIKRYPFIDASKQVAGGASYGGHLAYALEAWSGTRFKALVAHAGLINLETQWSTSDTVYGRELMNMGPVWEQGEVWKTQSPIRFASQFKTPILLSVGEKDFRVPMNNTMEAFTVLQRLQVPSRLLVWPDENHWILNGENGKVFYKEVADWLERWVK